MTSAMTRRFLAILLGVAALAIGGHVWADAASDWDAIVAMDATGPSGDIQNRDEARKAALDYMGKQEKVLRDFVAAYPTDPHTPDAKLRLAHLLATRADLNEDPGDRRASDAILEQLESDPAMKDRQADLAFARISIFMQRVDSVTGANREPLLEKARAFAKTYPGDRRVAPLLAEVAGAYEDQPKTERALLTQALPAAQTDEVRSRITDDLKRLDLLGKPIEMKWTDTAGERIDLQNYRGKVVLIYFFASWSSPSMYELQWFQQLLSHYPPKTVQAIGICLDTDPVGVPAMLADRQITFPVYCDGASWQGKLVRSLGVNEIPMLWILDHDGNLLTLDAKDDAGKIIEKAESALDD